MTTTTSLPRVPEGLRDLMKVYTKEVLREKPPDLYDFSANFFNLIVSEKSHQAVRKYEPVQTYETIMKNRIRQQVPLSMVFNIIPETLTDLIKKFIKAVLREKPENIYIFAQEYFQKLSKEKSGRIEYTKYSTYEKSLKGKENVPPVSKVTCECGRVLSAQAKDLGKAVSTETTKLETITDQTSLSSSISYVKSVVIIQRHFRRYLKQKKIGREKNKCNSVEYMTAIILIQRQFRRVLAKKQVEKLRKSRPPQLSYVKFNAANYMKAVVVIQRHYRIYLKRKQEQNRLKTDPVSLATAAIIIQRAFRRMVAVRRARRTASVTADPGEELNDNASETGSYTSVSTALLSTESTELGIASYEEKVHQKIIHEDEEVENNNVDASLEKEYFAEPIKGDDKSIDPRKSEILNGALIENKILKNSLEKENGIKEKGNKISAEMQVSGKEAEKPLEPVIEDEFTATKVSKQKGFASETFIKTSKNSKDLQQENDKISASEAEKSLTKEIAHEFTENIADRSSDSALETDSKTKEERIDRQQELEAELTSKKASIDFELEGKDDLETINGIKNLESEVDVKVKIEDDIIDPVKPADEVLEGSALPNKIDGIENDDIKKLVSKESEEIPLKLEEKQIIEKDNAILSKKTIQLAKEKSSESPEIPEKPIETEVTPKVSIEIELVDDDNPEQSILILPEADVNSGKDLSDVDTLEEQPRSLPTVEIDSLKTVLTNHNREVREQESTQEVLHDEDIEKTSDALTEIQTQEVDILATSNSTNKQDDEVPAISREKRSLDDSENMLTSSQQQSMEIQEKLNENEKKVSPLTAEKSSIEDTEAQSNLENQNSLNKQDNEVTPLTREKRSIEDKEISSSKSSLDVQEPIIPDDADSSLNIIEKEEKSEEKEKKSILKAESETTLEIDDKYKEEVKIKEEVTSKGDLSDLIDAETGEITVHKSLEEITEPLKQETTTDQAPQTDLIADSKEKEDLKSEMKVEPIVADRKSSMEIAYLTETEKEDEIIHHLEVGLLMEPKIDEEIKNTDISPEESSNSVKKVTEDPSDASEGSETLEENRKLSHQETMPIGFDPLQVEDTAPADGITGIASNSLELTNIESDNSKPNSNTDETSVEDKNKSIENAKITESSVFGEDTSRPSIETKSERIKREVSVDFVSNENTNKTSEQNVETGTQDIEGGAMKPTRKPSADEAQQSIETNEEDSAPALKEISNEGSGIVQVKEETQETVPHDDETITVKDGKLMDESTGLGTDSLIPEDAGTSTAAETLESKEISVGQSPESPDINSRESKEKITITSMINSPSLESFKNNEKRAEEYTVADAALAMVSETSRTTSLSETDQEPIPKESVNTEESLKPLSIADNPENEEPKDTKPEDNKSLIEPSLSEDKSKDISESLEETKPESDVEKEDPVEGSIAPEDDDKAADPETKPKGSETPKEEDAKEIIKTSSLEDKAPTSNEKALTSVPSHPEKNSSLLVSNQLIGTQNLPTNRNEIEKNTKKLSSASVRDKDKDIGTSTSGRLVPTPIAELQLKSFKAPNDDGAWYDIYVEPQQPSDKDIDNSPPTASVLANRTDKDQQITPEVEPIVVAERVPSYYTPKEIIEPKAPKAKNSISFFVSFDSDDGKPKYKIPKKFQDQSKNDTLDKKSDPEPDNNDEDIEVIEVSEGDPEYQQMGGSKLQTIMELNENEHPEVAETSKDTTDTEKSDQESVIKSESLSENQLVDSTKSNTQHFESVYKTDILNITRSVQIIERAYRRFKNRRLLDSQESSDYIEQNNAAKIIQKWVRNFLIKKSPTVTSDISRGPQESLAARKIQRAYRRYVEKSKESNSVLNSEERAEKENRAALIIQKAFREYSNKNMAESKKQFSDRMEFKKNQAARKIQRAYKRYLKNADKSEGMPSDPVLEEPIKVYKAREVNASPNDKLNKEDTPQEVNSKPSSMPATDLSGLTELIQHQAAEKIQRAYKRYLKKDNKPEEAPSAPVLEEPIKPYKATEVNANPNPNLNSDKPKEEVKLQEGNSKPSYSPTKGLSGLTELQENQAAEKIQRAYKRYLKKANKPEVILDSELEEPIKVYKSTEVYASPNSNLSTALNSDKPKEEDITQEDSTRLSSHPAKDYSGLIELKQHQAAEKIQRAYRRYLKQSNKPEIGDFESEESKKVEKPVEVTPSEGMARAALIIQRAYRQYIERRKLENDDEISVDSITSSRITAIENSMCPTEVTPSDSLIQEEVPSEDATKISPKSEWFVGSTRIVPSQGVVEEPLELETEPDPAEITRNTELDTSTQVETVETVDSSHGSLDSKLTPGISSSKIDENQGNTSRQDNAVSSGLAGLTETEALEAGPGSAEDRELLSQSDFGGIFQTLDIASTQELVNDFLNNEIQYSSAQGPYLNGNQLQEVIEEPCIKRSASLVSLSEGETGNDSSKSEATGLDTLSADTIDKATVKLSKAEEVIEKMAQLRDSKSREGILSAEPSFDEPIVRPMSSLQEQASFDIEDGDIIVYNRLQRDETRESSAQSDSVVFGEAESDKLLDREMATEEESGRVHLMRHYTIAGDDPRGLFRSVTIDDALSYGEMGEKELDASLGINSTNSFYLDDETSENIRKKMMAYSLSETDSDYFDPKKMSKEDFDIDTAMADAMGTSTETESTIVSAATKIQAGARGFLTRRRLRRASAGTKSSTMDTKASFGNDAISESLERFIEEEAAKKIQAAYRIHTRKRKGKTRRMEGISLESNLAARRQKLQRGDALRNDSTPDDENSSSTNGGQKDQKHSKSQRTKAGGEAKSRAAMELKWLTMRQNSMPVQIDCEVFRVIPKHMRKRIKSAESSKRK